MAEIHLGLPCWGSYLTPTYCRKGCLAYKIGTTDDIASEPVYKLSDRSHKILVKAQSAEERNISTVDGKLEQVNVHGDENIFKIYRLLPTAPPVTCKFPPELFTNVQSALGRYVSVRGECFYHPDASFAHKINVREMEVLPPTDELPSLGDLYGIAPNATGNKSAEQFVRALRDKWDEKYQ